MYRKKKTIRNIAIIIGAIILISVTVFIFNINKTTLYKNISDKQLSSNTSTKTTNADFTVVANQLKAGVKDESSIEFNSEYLQMLVDNASDAGGGIVHIPSGTYYFSTSGMTVRGGSDYVIMCRNNVTIEGEGSSTILKPYGTTQYGLDMFYFNEYSDSNFTNPEYLENADFRNFVIDGQEANCQTYSTSGKGFMINLYKDCDWENVIVKNTDGTGFGMDCPINSTIINCEAIGCGKAAKDTQEGASGFGIGTGYSENESIYISDCTASNNKKYGFFFEHQGRFNDSYKARSADGFVVRNCVSKGNMHEYGGERSNDVIYENCISIDGDGRISHMHFERTSRRTYITNCDAQQQYSDVTDSSQYYYEPIYWALDNSITEGINYTEFGLDIKATRGQVITFLWRMAGRPGTVVLHGESYNGVFSDVASDSSYVDAIKWAKEENIIDSSSSEFKPDEGCTRADFLIFLWKYAGSPIVSGSNDFTDIEPGSECEKAVIWAISKGITDGSGPGTEFKPNSICEREDVVTFLYRYCNAEGVTYNIRYNLGGGNLSSSNPTTYESGTSYITLKNPTRTGYSFRGWTGSNGDIPQTITRITTTAKGDKVYTANWERNTYYIEFDSNTGNGSMDKETYTYDVLGALPENQFTKDKAEFVCWNTKPDGTGTSYTDKERIMNLTSTNYGTITLYAQWNNLEEEHDAEFTVEHYKENFDGTYKKEEIETYKADAESEVTPEVKTYRGFTSPEKQTITVASDGSTVVKYYYTRNSYTVTITKGKGIDSVSGEGTYKFEENVTLSANVSNGYENAIWTIQGSGGINTNFLMPDSDINIDVNAQAIKYPITYNLDGGTASGNPDEYTIEDTFSLQAPIKSGFTFLGWTGSNGTTPEKNVTINAGTTGEKEYTANWQQNIEEVFEVTVEYSNKVITKDDVVVTIRANMEMQPLQGWQLSSDNMSMTKTYSSNINEQIDITSKNGKKVQTVIQINNIDKTQPKVDIKYEYNKDKNEVTVIMTSDEELQDMDGWNTIDNRTYTKVYTVNKKEDIIIKDFAGNEVVVTIDVNQIEDDPDNPTDPDDPDNPTDPDDPDDPTNPDDPDDPTDPDDPDNPTDPDDPDDPTDPDDPNNPTDPDNDDSELIHVDKVNDGKDYTIADKDIPQTGNEDGIVIITAIGIITITGIITFVGYRKYKDV